MLNVITSDWKDQETFSEEGDFEMGPEIWVSL